MQKKKIFTLATAILLAIGLCACSGGKETGESSSLNQSSSSQSYSSSVDSESSPDNSVETDSSLDDSVEIESSPEDSEDTSSEDSSKETWTGIYKPKSKKMKEKHIFKEAW